MIIAHASNLLKMLTLCIAVSVCSCDYFTEPQYSSKEEEAKACEESWFCRTIVDDTPSWSYRYNVENSDDVAYATEIIKLAVQDGRNVKVAIGTLRGRKYTLAIVDGWVYHNGDLAGPRVFKQKELGHWIDSPEIIQTRY